MSTFLRVVPENSDYRATRWQAVIRYLIYPGKTNLEHEISCAKVYKAETCVLMLMLEEFSLPGIA